MESAQNKKSLPCYAVLLIITLAAGLVLGATYLLTKDTIAERILKEEEESRKNVLPDAVSFEKQEFEDAGDIDWLYVGKDETGKTVGYVAKTAVNGYKGEIEVIAAVKPDGTVSAISVGGSNFSETAGLGAKSKDAAFTDKFKGKSFPLSVLKTGDAKDENGIDALTSATITSRAVVNAVNKIGAFVSETYIDAPVVETSETGGEEE